MNKFISIIIVLFCFGASSAQNIVPLWVKGQVPNCRHSNQKEEVLSRNSIFIKNVQEPTLEVLLPSKGNANRMGILICPGGGYNGVSYDWEGTDVAKWLNSIGVAAFVLKYRTPQAESVVKSYEAPLQDAQRAMRYIRHNAEKFNIDNNKIGIIGFSAGGHLAATLGTHFENSLYESNDSVDSEGMKPDFMMLIYPVISMKEGITHRASRRNLLGENPTEKLVDTFSNELQVDTNTPPTFILHCGDDKAVPVENSIRMYQALVNKGIPTEMHIYPKGGHGFGLGKSRVFTPDWRNVAEGWIEKLTRNSESVKQ